MTADKILEKHRVFQDEKGRRAKQAMIEFAQYHVEKALLAASKETLLYDFNKEILNCYPKENIK